MTGAPGETFYSLADILSEMKGIRNFHLIVSDVVSLALSTDPIKRQFLCKKIFVIKMIFQIKTFLDNIQL